MLITIDEFIEYTGADITPMEFERYRIKAEKMMCDETITVDGICKLKQFPPTAIDDLLLIKFGIANIILMLKSYADIDANMSNAVGYTVDENGTLQGKVVRSKSSGSESISYDSGASMDKSIGDLTERNRRYKEMVFETLRGIKDSNGVNLLYAGVYPG